MEITRHSQGPDVQEHEFSRIERAPAYRLVYDAIERQILAGRLRVGDPLPAETQLAEQFGVNRSTVREGIRLLEQSGLVERDGGKRPRISVPHYLDLASSASRALILHMVTFRELWEASMVLEPAIAERAAGHIDEKGLADLSANIAAMTAEVEGIETGRPADVYGFVGLDRAFHEILANVCGNRVLALAHEPVTSLFIPAGRIILPRLKTYRRVLDAHRYIFDCLVAGDAPGARTWMHKHMDDFRRAYELTALSLDTSLDAASLGMVNGTAQAHSR
ncbi:MAG TPA: FCD domain-containing protein [Aliidongia sp.]|uniref:FadR/GntR family transcriptional regulator n=1 Tax=Aliidongia sp. TaxID=1914230 RepID=UPI002DDD99A4|nr:FCD domain-containing protein [Aliidongia sp.]HEV2677388.1 FCD domain-containing protein [Aliidongia sp.]